MAAKSMEAYVASSAIRFKHQFPPVPYVSKGEVIDQPSMTLPDQSLSIPEIMERYSRGLNLGANTRTEIYHGEDDEFPDLSRMDLVEREEYILNRRQELDDLKSKLESEAKQRQLEKRSKAKPTDSTEDANQPKGGSNETTTAQ